MYWYELIDIDIDMNTYLKCDYSYNSTNFWTQKLN